MYRKPVRAKLTGIIAGLLAVVACRGQVATQTAPAASQPAIDPTVDRILTRLENRAVNDLRARVSWTLRYVLDLEEDAVTKNGQLWYQQQKPVAKFLVHFSEKVAAGRRHELDERHLFDGRWYIEMRSEPSKTFERREVRREGDQGNPYRIGEGPFPVPFGQKKADILREFEVTLLPQAAGGPPATDHLKLVPREGTQSGGNYKQVDVWVAREGPQAGLPIKVHTAKKDGTGKVNSFITLAFEDIKLNVGFSTGVFELTPPPGYDVYEERLEPIPPPPAPEGAPKP